MAKRFGASHPSPLALSARRASKWGQGTGRQHRPGINARATRKSPLKGTQSASAGCFT